MLKLDIDDFRGRTRLELQKIMHSMPVPFLVRVSSSTGGLHIAVPYCNKWDYRRMMFDDKMRIELDEQRERQKLPVSNLLWDVKNGKRAGPWRVISNSIDVENYLDSIAAQRLYANRASRIVSRKWTGTEK